MRARKRDSHIQRNPKDIYILRDKHVVERLVRSANPRPGDQVVEFGAGTGVLTQRLAQTGARILAVERNRRMISRLERRFGDENRIRVVADDARTVPLPRRPYLVVANVPYSITTAIVRRLLSPPETPVQRADLLVEWGFAKRMTQSPPRDFETAWWQARYDLTIARRIQPQAFTPAPSVNSAHLVIRRHPMRRSAERKAWDELRSAYGLSAKAARRAVSPRL